MNKVFEEIGVAIESVGKAVSGLTLILSSLLYMVTSPARHPDARVRWGWFVFIVVLITVGMLLHAWRPWCAPHLFFEYIS